MTRSGIKNIRMRKSVLYGGSMPRADRRQVGSGAHLKGEHSCKIEVAERAEEGRVCSSDMHKAFDGQVSCRNYAY